MVVPESSGCTTMWNTNRSNFAGVCTKSSSFHYGYRAEIVEVRDGKRIGIVTNRAASSHECNKSVRAEWHSTQRLARSRSLLQQIGAKSRRGKDSRPLTDAHMRYCTEVASPTHAKAGEGIPFAKGFRPLVIFLHDSLHGFFHCTQRTSYTRTD